LTDSSGKGSTYEDRLLLVRSSAIIILLAHVLIVISLFFPYESFQVALCTGWQRLLQCPNPLVPFDPYTIRDLNRFIVALALTSLASVAVLLSPSRMMGLIGVWISLPLTLFYYFFWEYTALYYHDHIGVSPAVWFPPVGFALSFLSCLALALYLPLLRARSQGRRATGRPDYLEAGQHEGAEQVSHLDGGELPAYATRRSLWPHPAFIVLLCYLLIGLSLWFPYIELDDGMEGGLLFGMTGWQILGNAFGPRNDFTRDSHLLPLVLPVLISLAGLLPFRRKSDHREALLFQSPYLSYLLNTMGFSLSLVVLALSLVYPGGDLHTVLHTDVAFVVPPAAFLLSFLYSTVLLDSRLRLLQARE
jgi:hypothetical protein